MGADRVGIVDELSGILAERKGNIEESKMAVLGGEFAVMMLVSMEAAAPRRAPRPMMADIETRLGLKIGLVPTHRTGVHARKAGPTSSRRSRSTAEGIVHSVSAVLHAARHQYRGHGDGHPARAAHGRSDVHHEGEHRARPGPFGGGAQARAGAARSGSSGDLDISLKPLLPSNPE